MTRPSLERIRKPLCAFSGALLTAALFGGYGVAQVATRAAPSGGEDASRRNGQDNPAATQADAWFENYRFRDRETLERNQLPRLAAWRDRIGHRPAVQTGMTAFDVKRETVN
jgi:hypothetical protein